MKDRAGDGGAVSDVLHHLKQGGMCIITDDDDRENEGDVMVPAELITAEIISFMMRLARGIICVTVTPDIADQKGLKLMQRINADENVAKFTFSIDALPSYGLKSGVSAYDRALTIKTLTDNKSTIDDFIVPGHVFPLVGNAQGLAARRGHTEASLALAQLAGFKPMGVICEVIGDDGFVMRGQELVAFAAEYDIKIVTIENIVNFIKCEAGNEKNLSTKQTS